MKTPHTILEKYWGHTSFRKPQEEIIKTVLNGQNTIVLLPTGEGKSLCFQIPGLLQKGVCIVISPLIALIQDQVNQLQEKGIKAIALTSQLSEEEQITAFDNLQFGNYKFLYLSPEKLQSPFVKEKLKQLHVSLIAIDEAHCISEWGHDFRPAYLQLNILREIFEKTPVIALTATATKKVLNDIQLNLKLNEAITFKKSIERPNLIFKVINTDAINEKLVALLKHLKSTSIVYCGTRNQTVEISKLLNKNDLKSTFYHGGLIHLEKKNRLKRWLNNETPIMVATNAFGMGINKADVRAVFHINIPNSIENLIQEAGRAGRDGKMASAFVLTNKSIQHQSLQNFELNSPSVDYIKEIYKKLNDYFHITFGELPSTLFRFSFQKFCSFYKLGSIKTYNAIKILEQASVLQLGENYNRKSSLKILISNSQLFNFINSSNKHKELIQLLLRTYGGLFENYISINELQLSKKLNCTKITVINQLHELVSLKIISYNLENSEATLFFLVPREDSYTINRISKNFICHHEFQLAKLNAVIAYLQNTSECRTNLIRNYFDEPIEKECGKCDNCNPPKISSKNLKNLSQEILNILIIEPKTSQELVNELNLDDQIILECLKLLLSENKINLTSRNAFKIVGK